jgi:hypothetical protein
LAGVSKVHRFPHYECANAVGAAIAQVSGSVDSVEEMGTRTIDVVRKEVEARAIQKAIEAGATPETVAIIESEAIPVAYTPGRCRFFAKAAGEWSGVMAFEDHIDGYTNGVEQSNNQRKITGKKDFEWTPAAIKEYKPKVHKGVWSLSEIDLEFICIGAYILGCGGGGDPHHSFLALRELVRKGHTINVVDLSSLPKDGLIGWGGGMGSPEVASERMLGEEYNESLIELLKFMRVRLLSRIECRLTSSSLLRLWKLEDRME